MVVGGRHLVIRGPTAAAISRLRGSRGSVSRMTTCIVSIVVVVLILVMAAAAAVFAGHVSLLHQWPRLLLGVVILSPIVAYHIRTFYAFALRRSRR